MWTFILRRILAAVPVVLGVALIVFSLFNLFGGDPALMLVGKHATAERVESIRQELGLNQPVWKQFLDYLHQIVTFDFGRSYTTREPIRDKIISGLAPTLSLTIPAFFITTFFSMWIGMIVSYFRGRFIDRVAVIALVLMMSLPGLAYILFAQYFLASARAEAWGGPWFPISGYSSQFPDNIAYLGLPVIIYILLNLGGDVRFFRNSFIEEVNQDYVRTARAKGLGEGMIYLKHVLKNSMIPVITYVVIQIPFLVLGSILLESFFAIPGLGGITVEAVNNRDFPVLKAMTTVISLLYIFSTILIDVLYRIMDPRMSFK